VIDQSLHHQSQEVQGEQGLDARLVLQEDGRDFVDRLDLLEALLNARLALVGGQDLGR
jgi:hypothetical protein